MVYWLYLRRVFYIGCQMRRIDGAGRPLEQAELLWLVSLLGVWNLLRIGQ